MIKKLAVDMLVRTPSENEQEAIVAMFNICDLADCGQADSPLEDFRPRWQNPGFRLETDAWVVVAPDGEIIAYGAIGGQRPVRLFFDLRVHPRYREQGMEEHLLGLIEARAAEFVALAPPDVRVTLQSWLHAGNLPGHTFLEAQDYIGTRHEWGMRIDLPQAPAKPAWPDGITLRPFVTERHARAVFEADDEAFRDHWGHLPGVFENWYQRSIAAREDFDPSLWFIAVDGEEIAGFALCMYYLQDGFVSSLGVRRPWRQKGLGLALLHHAFGEFYRRDVHSVALGVDSQNLTGAVRLYERAGMHIELQYDIYEKELRPGIDLRTQTLDE